MKNKKTIKTKTVIIKTKKILRPGSGRTKGSYSFVRIPWRVLKEYVGRMSEVTVSRMWAEANGLHFTCCDNSATTHKYPRLTD